MIRTACAVVMSLLATGAAGTACAQTEAAWPSKPVRFIVPFPAGGSTDAVARIVGQALGTRLGQQFVIENRTGASGTIGTEAVARAAPDGYTIGLATTTTLALTPSLTRNLSYDPVKDLAPVGMIGSSPFVLVIYPGLPAKTLADFIALAKAKPGAMSYGSAGSASIAHLATVLFANSAGIELGHIPYKASAQSATDMIAGRVEMQFATVGPVLPLLRSGQLRALGIASARRSAMLPDVPTLAEAGLPGYEASLWMAIVLPAGTPAAIVTRLNREVTAVLNSADTKEALLSQGVDTDPGTPEALGARVREEIDKWRGVIAKAGLRPE